MRAHTLRFLVFLVFTTLLTGFIAIQIANIQLEDQYTVSARFGDVTGLYEGDDVRVAGVPVGIVDSIELQGNEAMVTLAISNEVQVPSDSGAAITWLDLIGARQVDILPGEASDALQPGDEITDTRSTVDIGSLTAQLGPLARTLNPADLNELLDSVSQVLQGNEQQLVQTVTDARVLLDAVTSRDAVVDALITDYADLSTTLADREQQIRSTVDDLVLLARTFAETDDLLADGIGDAAAIADQVDTFLDRNGDELNALIEDFDSLVALFDEQSDTLDELLGDLPGAVRSFFAVGDQGDLLYVDSPCVSVTDPPCGSSGGVASLDSPASLGRFLRGEVG